MLVGKLQEAKNDLVDIITDFISERAPELCCTECKYNTYDAEINFSDCPDMQDVFNCECSSGLLVNVIMGSVEAIFDELPDPEIDFFQG